MSALLQKNHHSEPTPPRGGDRFRPAKGLKHILTITVAAADGLQVAFPPFWIPITLVTAVIMFAIWGWRWEILVVLVPELAPVIGILPTWTGVALYLTGRDLKRSEDHHTGNGGSTIHAPHDADQSSGRSTRVSGE